MTRNLQRGALIIFEGCDRSGKTTQVGKLVNRLTKEGFSIKSMRFPDRTTTIGKMINEYLNCSSDLEDHAIHLLFSANRWEMVEEMKKALNDGSSVIVDRYAFSGVAFSSAKDGMDLEWCKKSDVGLPKPDLVCFLNVSEEVARSRADFGGERYERTEFQKKVRNNYDHLMDNTWTMVDANRTLEEVHEDLYKLITSEIEKPKKEIEQLWMS